MNTRAGSGRHRMGGGRAAADGVRPGNSEVLELDVGEAAHGGWCVARDAAGRVVFVRHALPGERVRAAVTGATAKFARADAVEILAASPDRVDPPCPHARPSGCGGCDWQHASLPAQRRIKAEVIARQFRRIAGADQAVTVEPLPGDRHGLGWRTRIRFSVGPDGTAGLLKHRSHEVVAIGDCPLAHPLVREAGVTGQRWPGVAAVEVAVSAASGERAVIITSAPGRHQQAAAHAAALPASRADAVLLAHRGRLTSVRGRGQLRHRAGGRDWRAGAGAFWQVHPGLADTLTTAVLDTVAPAPGETALDLYCGAGLFAGVLAAAVGPRGTVIGVEADPAAVRDARHNLRDLPWARVHRGDVTEMLGQRGWPEAALAVLDPPRAGIPRAAIGHLLKPPGGSPARLRRIAYVSCDPATLARDVAVFAGSGWELSALRAFDAFPMTHHVECAATLTRR